MCHFINSKEVKIKMNPIERADQLFKQKYHCSQAVFAAFAPQFGLTEEQALKIGGSFGGGMCKGEVCGAVTGALMVIGLKHGQCRPEDLESKRKTNELTNLFMEKFKQENGSYICRELLKYDLSIEKERAKILELNLFTTFCPKMVMSATKILEEIL